MTKLLLDESIPRRFASKLPAHYEIVTVQSLGWSGTKNGELLRLAREHGFSALITADKNIEYQQNLSDLPCPVIVLNAYRTRLDDLEHLIPKLVKVLEEEISGVIHVGA
jgi:predicted nuclease of predicted toxin-antitoxin system